MQRHWVEHMDMSTWPDESTEDSRNLADARAAVNNGFTEYGGEVCVTAPYEILPVTIHHPDLDAGRDHAQLWRVHAIG
jgi:hypothetical protein